MIQGFDKGNTFLQTNETQKPKKLCFIGFRLVTDRETGKPKGYGFCEYKDEETALSARRNLQSYEINGRQLRVDFAENDKGTDKTRDQVTPLSLSSFNVGWFLTVVKKL